MLVCKINILIIVGAILVLGGSVCTNTSFSASAQTSMEITSDNASSNDTYISQKTEMSVPASPMVTPPGKLPHQTVFALPLRDDGKIWTGVVTFTASKPIEIEVLHNYDPNILPDPQHGEPYHATLPTNQTIALSTMSMFTDTPVRVTDTPISTGSLAFTGSALVFHKTSGEPFTVTYTVDAVAKKPNHQ